MTIEQGELLDDQSLVLSDIRASAIVVYQDSDPVIWLCLEALLAQDGLLEILLVDNGLDAEGRQRLQQLADYQPKIRILDVDHPVNEASARHQAAVLAKGSSLLMLSASVILPPRALVQLFQALQEKQVGMVSPRLVDAEGQYLRENRTNLLTPRNFVAELQNRPQDRDAGLGLFLPDVPQLKDPIAVPSLPPYVMLCDKALYFDHGGLNGHQGLLLAGWEWCLRLRAKGLRLLWVPSVTGWWLGNPWDAAEQRRALSGIEAYWKQYFTEPSDRKTVRRAIWLPRLRRLLRRKLHRHLKRRAADYALHRHQLLRQLFLLQDYEQTPSPLLTTARELPLHDGEIWLHSEQDSALCLAIFRRLMKAGAELRVLRSQPLPFSAPKLRWSLPGLAAEGAPQTAIWLGNPVPDEPTLRHWQRQGLKQLLWVVPALWQEGVKENGFREPLPDNQTHTVTRQTEREFFGLCERLKIRATIFRHGPTYGLGVGDSLSELRDHIGRKGWVGLPKTAIGRRQPLQVEDAARAILRAIGAKDILGMTIALAGGETLTLRELVTRMQEAEGQKPRLITHPLCRRWKRFCGHREEFAVLEHPLQDQTLDVHAAVTYVKFQPGLFEPGQIARCYLDALEA